MCINDKCSTCTPFWGWTQWLIKKDKWGIQVKFFTEKGSTKLQNSFYEVSIILLQEGNKFDFECVRAIQLPFRCISKCWMFQIRDDDYWNWMLELWEFFYYNFMAINDRATFILNAIFKLNHSFFELISA